MGGVLDQDRRTLNYVYNTGTGEWERMTQPGGSGGGDGAILDGANSAIKATVREYTGSNPLAVEIVDTAGDPISVGGGTQYTEDAAAAANPVGTALNLVRKDDPQTTVVNADGDNLALRGTNFGAAYTTLINGVDGAFVDVASDTKLDDIITRLTAGATTIAKAEDAAHSSGDVGVMGLAVRQDALSVLGADGDYVPLVVSATGRLYGTVIATDVVPGVAATNLGKAEDGAHTTGDVGVMGLAVRTDTPANRSGTDGDYEPLQMAAGRLWASVVVTDVVPGAAATNLGKAEDGAHTSGDVGVMALAVRTDTPANRSGTDGDYEPLQMSAGRAWASAIITDIVPGSGATNLGKAEDAAHASGDVGVSAMSVRQNAPAVLSGADGDYQPVITNEVGGLWATLTPSANGGGTTMNASSSDGGTALTNSAQAIKASAGVLLGYYIYNPNATAQFVQFYNTASGSVTVGTTNPLFMLTIPATSAANLAFPYPVAFGTAMSWAATSTAGGNGAPGTAMDAVAWYK